MKKLLTVLLSSVLCLNVVAGMSACGNDVTTDEESVTEDISEENEGGVTFSYGSPEYNVSKSVEASLMVDTILDSKFDGYDFEDVQFKGCGELDKNEYFAYGEIVLKKSYNTYVSEFEAYADYNPVNKEAEVTSTETKNPVLKED